MIRKIYLDILRRRLADRDVGWLTRAATRYPLVVLSSMVGRPLCGPILGTLVTNYSCNCRCAMCDLPSGDGRLRADGLAKLGTDGLKSVLDQFKGLGVMGVGFTGGEPLLHEDILGLLGHCRRLGILTHLNTNGLLLDDRVSRELVGIGVDSVNISLDGARASTHDSIRGVEGAFESATEAIRRVLASRGQGKRPRVKAVMVVQGGNVNEIQEFAGLVAGLGADCIEFIPEQPFVRDGARDLGGGDGGARNRGSGMNREAGNHVGDLAQSAQNAIISLLRASPVPIENSPRMMELIPLTLRGKSSPLRCYAGYNSITVDCYGRVFPCLPWLNWGRNAVLADPARLVELWKSDSYGERRRLAAACHDCTLNCQAELNLLFNPFRRIHRTGRQPTRRRVGKPPIRC